MNIVHYHIAANGWIINENMQVEYPLEKIKLVLIRGICKPWKLCASL